MRVTVQKTIARARSIVMDRPANFAAGDERWFPHWGNYKTNDLDVFLINEANVTGHGVVFDGMELFEPSLVYPNFRSTFGTRYLLKCNLLYRKVRTDDNLCYVLAFDHWAMRNYYHWVVDTLPRLFVIKDDLPDCVVLAPAKAGRYVYDSVETLFKPRAILEIGRHSYVRVRNLILPRHIAESGRHDGEILTRMKKFILDRSPARGSISHEKIYVSRARQKMRRIRNEAEVEKLLREMGFAVVRFEGMSFWEQVELMRNTRYLVSNHGANLTNLLFMPHRGKVLEINQNVSPNLCYWSLAHSTGLKYYYQLCPVVGKRDDLLVDVSLLERNVELMFRQ